MKKIITLIIVLLVAGAGLFFWQYPTALQYSKAKLSSLGSIFKTSLFHEKVRVYVESGSLFRMQWNNFDQVVWMKEVAPGAFFAFVKFNRGGGSYFYEIRSFEFPLSKEVVSKIREVGGTYWSAETIKKNGFQSLGLIIANRLNEDGRNRSILRAGAYYNKNEEWKFSYKKMSGYWLAADEIAKMIYGPSPYLQKKYLDEEEMKYLKDPEKMWQRDYRATMYKKIQEMYRESRGHP